VPNQTASEIGQANMSDFLAYLQHYWNDVRKPENLLPGWGTKGAYFHKEVMPGDVIWVITTGGPEYPEEWRLLQRIHISELYDEPTNEYRYRARENRQLSQVFDPNLQANMETLLKKLHFASGKSITLSGRRIGRALRRIRRLSEADALLLEQYAKGLTTSRRARN
jgi:hypothetical protein